MSSELQYTVPILRVFSKEKTWEFYIDYLGFSFDWAERMDSDGPIYAQISRNDVALHLSGHHEDGAPGSAVLIRMRGLEDLHKELQKKKYPFLNPQIVDTPWNARVMELIDPFNNHIRFSEKKL